MRALNLVVQTSLDGFVAGANGSFDHFIGGEENLAFICSIIDEADTLLLGRVTYEMLNSYWQGAAGLPDATKNMIKYLNWYNAASTMVCRELYLQIMEAFQLLMKIFCRK